MTRLRSLARNRVVAVGLVVLLLAASAVGLLATRGDAAGTWRTATAQTGDVTEALVTSGTVDASRRRDAAAAVAGTVATVKAEVGATVRAGDVLVVLDRTAAARAVRKAQATLAQAELDLTSAGTAQTSAASRSTSTPTSAPVTTPATSTSTSKPSTSAQPAPAAKLPDVALPVAAELTALQDSVTAAQTASTTARSEAAAALATQTAACGTAYSRTPEGTADDAATAADTACDQALAAVEQAQAVADTKQQELQTALTALTDALVEALAQTDAGVQVLQAWLDQQEREVQQSSGTPAGDTDDEPTATGQATVPQQPSVSTDTSADVAAVATRAALSVAQGQAAVDEAKAALVKAEQELAATRIVAGIAGTVTAVDTAVGSDVAAGDTVATVVGKGGATVALSLTIPTVRSIHAGQAVEVLLPAASTPVAGEVTWVNPVATAGSPSLFGGTSSYVAEINVPASELADAVLPQGARAEVTITLGTSTDVLTVPTSAVVAGANGATVQVVGGDGADGVESVRVETGRMGAARTEITSGLEQGDEVVLADLDAEVDAAGEISTSTSTGGFPRPGGQRQASLR